MGRWEGLVVKSDEGSNLFIQQLTFRKGLGVGATNNRMKLLKRGDDLRWCIMNIDSGVAVSFFAICFISRTRDVG